MLEVLNPVGKIALPIAIVSAALLWPKTEAPAIIIELSELPAPVISIEASEFPAFPVYPETKPPIITVNPNQPIITEKVIEVPGATVYEDRIVTVEKIVEVRTCLNFDELPSWDLARAVSMARPGESWSLSGDYYPGLNWLDSTPKPSEGEIIAGWLKALEKDCDS